jgi:hypothetical protein
VFDCNASGYLNFESIASAILDAPRQAFEEENMALPRIASVS